uniref:Uncharacterized protein n=1 Tax=Macaca fascicularis TaxID=9541 RepID=A0A7N9D7R7_MACFA
MGIILTL